MSYLLSKYHAPDEKGRTQCITPETAGWDYIGFSVYELMPEQIITLPVTPLEQCLVLVAGRATVITSSQTFKNIGERMDPFEKIPPWAVYLKPNETCQIIAETALELAVCQAPGKSGYATRLITPQQIKTELRGVGNNQRFVQNILPDDEPAGSLLIVEVYTAQGCTSSYPSHKHDTDIPGKETRLEETYYHRLKPSQGFCLQRVYTDDRSLDETMAVYNKDVVMVPKGYHPVATLAGYDSYYLNVMAGPNRKWLFSWEKDHQWINTPEYTGK